MAKIEMTILVLSSMFVTIFTAVNGYGTIVGGKTPISDVSSNKGVQELGRFAVAEYNKSQLQKGNGGGNQLEFSQVVEAGQQIVSGIKYFLKIEATENGEKKTFDAVVLIKPWSQPEERQMLSFSASNQ
ncbi:Tetratricopeptide repeat (TPR)-like superfamily protein isoform 1 [Hibiscus syriacus]|uniref:Tetratricopeptide repeat (TPR)-like superfamily protein isoform 1 n=1 Tax=Hibiscus syriacus TaxID=106335 RepID=A0A6A3A339_HIBSY|nr:cysteine proteinase inhibitor B-like [Hibiscus syriacus]KAE8698057.1 Tetratricopeptide repeat (TPR)-like superfamily protein isoform 1 [Hibiscus syriacus]